jgi:hypothetical protein
VAAPGYKVPAQGRDGQYWYVSGTSPACALTAGVVALIKAAYPHLTDTQVISAITSSTTASTRPPGGYDEQIGFGVVDAAAAMTAARRLAAAAPAPAGLAPSRHFGGGLASIPAAPVLPRGLASLVLYCLLGAACLTVVAIATSRLLAQRDADMVASGGPANPGGPGAPWATGGGYQGAGDNAAGQPSAGPYIPGYSSGGQRGAGYPEADDEAGPSRHAAPRNHGHHWPGPP